MKTIKIEKIHTVEHMEKMRLAKQEKKDIETLKMLGFDVSKHTPKETEEMKQKIKILQNDLKQERQNHASDVYTAVDEIRKLEAKSPVSKQENRKQTLLIWIIGIINILPVLVASQYMMIQSVLDYNPIGYVLSASIIAVIIAIGILAYPFITGKKK
jgi:cation transport ATPase